MSVSSFLASLPFNHMKLVKHRGPYNIINSTEKAMENKSKKVHRRFFFPLYVQGHPMDTLVKISVLQVNFNLLAGRFGTSNM